MTRVQLELAFSGSQTHSLRITTICSLAMLHSTQVYSLRKTLQRMECSKRTQYHSKMSSSTTWSSSQRCTHQLDNKCPLHVLPHLDERSLQEDPHRLVTKYQTQIYLAISSLKPTRIHSKSQRHPTMHTFSVASKRTTLLVSLSSSKAITSLKM